MIMSIKLLQTFAMKHFKSVGIVIIRFKYVGTKKGKTIKKRRRIEIIPVKLCLIVVVLLKPE